MEPNRVWRTYPGGKILDQHQGIAFPKDGRFPEDWIASTTRAVNKGREAYKDEGLSKVTFQGKRVLLKWLFEQYPKQILGKGHFEKYGANTQFLLKFLDSAIRLHLQAHPTIAFAKKHLNSNAGKTEAYLILDIREEVEQGYIYLGFQHPLPRAEFANAVETQDIQKLLACFEKISIRKGDVFIVPGGLPHAIGEGILMIEIMEPTDFAVRLEFERGGIKLPESARFMGRNVDFAMDIIDFKARPVAVIRQENFCNPELVDTQPGGAEYLLIDEVKTPCFSVSKVKIDEKFIKTVDSFYVGIVTKGSGKLNDGISEISIKEGDRFLVSYSTESVEYIAGEPLERVFTFPPL